MPFLVMLPVASTRNVPPVVADELEERGTLLLDTTALDEELWMLLLETIELDELRTLLLDELDGTEEDELERTELLTTLELLQAPLTPNGAGWVAHVALEIQLLLFS